MANSFLLTEMLFQAQSTDDTIGILSSKGKQEKTDNGVLQFVCIRMA